MAWRIPKFGKSLGDDHPLWSRNMVPSGKKKKLDPDFITHFFHGKIFQQDPDDWQGRHVNLLEDNRNLGTTNQQISVDFDGFSMDFSRKSMDFNRNQKRSLIHLILNETRFETQMLHRVFDPSSMRAENLELKRPTKKTLAGHRSLGPNTCQLEPMKKAHMGVPLNHPFEWDFPL